VIESRPGQTPFDREKYANRNENQIHPISNKQATDQHRAEIEISLPYILTFYLVAVVRRITTTAYWLEAKLHATFLMVASSAFVADA